MTRKYRLERTAFIGCRNTAYMDVDDAEPCPFCGSRQVTIYPYGQGTTSYVEGVPTLYLSSATCKSTALIFPSTIARSAGEIFGRIDK